MERVAWSFRMGTAKGITLFIASSIFEDSLILDTLGLALRGLVWRMKGLAHEFPTQIS